MKGRLLAISLLVVVTVTAARAQVAIPSTPTYTTVQCQGSLMPYPAPKATVSVPDSLTPVYITYVGRHGARYPASANHARLLEKALLRADSLGTLTPMGRSLLSLDQEIIRRCADRWGSLDSLGMAEMRGIASRMMSRCVSLFTDGAVVNGLSSYSPRVMMSMYEFTHQMDRLNNRLSFVTSTGRGNSPLCRPFDTAPDFAQWLRQGDWKEPYDSIVGAMCPLGPVMRAVGDNYSWPEGADPSDIALAEYYVLAGCSAMGLSVDPVKYMTVKEYNALWSCFNLRQYLQRTASVLGTGPADIASDLLEHVVSTTDRAAQGQSPCALSLIMGHAETLMPLLSLMRLKGCYYLTNYFDTVAENWRDWDIVPMGANLQLILLRHPGTRRHYLMTLLNERPMPLLPSDDRLIVPWSEARDYLTRCLPLYM